MNNISKHSTRLKHAYSFLAQGIAVIPLHHRSKQPLLSTWHPYMTVLPTERELNAWLCSDWHNYAVVCGWCNLVVIDFDTIEMYDLWSLWCGTQYGSLPAFRVRTARGMHVYVRTEAPIANQKRRHIDIQAQGKYVVGPGSVHPSGHVYEPIGEMVFPCVELDEILPVALFPLVHGDCGSFSGAPVEFHRTTTEYHSEEYDPFAAASMSIDIDLIAKVKSAVRIESLFSDIRKTSMDNRWYAARCPFHDDNRPSMWIDVRNQICGCTVCNFKPLDVINLYARMHSISESAAVRAMAEEIGVWR